MTLARADALANMLTNALAGEMARVRARARAWAQVWSYQAEAEAEAEAQALQRALARTRVEQRARGKLPWALAHAKAKVNMVPYGEVLADSALMRIIYSIKPEHRRRLARALWRHSEHWWFIQIIVPITRLPQELLHQILLILIDNPSESPSILIQVSKQWYPIVTGIWASLKLGTSTPRDAVMRKLERNQFLDVVIDTNIDRGGFTPSEGAYQGILVAIQAAPRWRSLVVETFPAQTDLPEQLMDNGREQCSDVVMRHLRSFKFKSPCETSSLLQRLLRILGTAAGGELTTVEINSASVISFLAPTYPSIFHSVKILCLDTPQLPDPVDILPHLHQLEALTASHLSLPIYHIDINLPFVHTLRHLTLRAVSIQWMSGRTFHALESCTLLYPRHRNVLNTFNTTLPNCNDLTFRGYPLDILNGISAHNLTHLTVKCSCSEKPPGSRGLVQFSSHALREDRLSPRILHISIEASNQAWIKAFPFMSNLEELVIDNADPSSLGVQALQALAIHPGQAINMGIAATPVGQNTPACPLLKRFGLRYRRWLRPTEHFDLIPELAFIILSRQLASLSLRSFRIWKERGQKEPLELIAGPWALSRAFWDFTSLSGEDLSHLMASLADRLSMPPPLPHALKGN